MEEETVMIKKILVLCVLLISIIQLEAKASFFVIGNAIVTGSSCFDNDTQEIKEARTLAFFDAVNQCYEEHRLDWAEQVGTWRIKSICSENDRNESFRIVSAASRFKCVDHPY